MSEVNKSEFKSLQYYKKLIESRVQELLNFESSGHDIDHLKRVYNLALHIQKKEGGDRLVIGLSAYLHDIHRLKENKTGKYISPKESLPDIKSLLEAVNLPQQKVNAVLHCIEFHEEYGFSETGKTVSDLETLILQDADNLDAICAIGIARTFAYHATKGDPLWNQEIPLNRKTYDESQKDPDAIHHIHSKLLKLGENMNTETAKIMAANRHNFIEKFLLRFKQEWIGKI